MTAACPNCKEDIEVVGPLEVDREVDCLNCDAELIITDTSPLTLVDVYGDDPGAIEDMDFD